MEKSNRHHTYDVCIVSANPDEGLIQRIQCGHNIGRARRIVRIALACGHAMTWICCGETWSRTSTQVVDNNASKVVKGATPERLDQLTAFYAKTLKRFGKIDCNGLTQFPEDLEDNAETSPFPMEESAVTQG
jgi:hypothetical protein